MTDFTLDITHSQLARWLTVTLGQRNRAAAKAAIDFTAEHPATLELKSEAAQIGAIITELTKLAAASPQIQKKR